MIPKVVALIAVLFLSVAPVGIADAGPTTTVQVIGNVSPRFIDPLARELAAADPSIVLTYRYLQSDQVMTSVMSPSAGGADLVILSTPDLAVQIANEGFAQSYEPQQPGLGSANWRNEVFTIASDPVVIVTRQGVLSQREMPQSRLELAQLVENSIARFTGRTGVMNIGVDSLGYFIAAQESLRSPLFWRVARDLGKTRARVYNRYSALLDDLATGKISIAYNVPLSEVNYRNRDDITLSVMQPKDFLLASQWSAVIPRGANPYQARRVLDFILSPRGQQTLTDAGVGHDPATTDAVRQEVALGPQLLVFLDPMKRSRFLDNWIQLVADP